MTRLGLVGAVILAIVPAIASSATQAEPYRLRGTLVGVDDRILTVMNDDEETFEVALTEDTELFAVRSAKWSDLQPGQFLGVTSVESGGERVALEVHIFAEDLRGIGEGHYPWDLVDAPNTMTNATVAEIEEVSPAERKLRLTYREGEGESATSGEQVVLVPDFVDVVFLEKGEDPDLLQPDRRVFLFVEDAAEAPPEAIVVAVGVGGAIPPM